MKKIISIVIFIVVIAALVTVFVFRRSIPKTSEKLIITPTPGVTQPLKTTDTPTSIMTSNNFTVDWLIVRDPGKIILYSNLVDKLSSLDAMKKFECVHLVSGGFWGEGGNPIGLFIYENKLINKSVSSDLFNAYFFIDNNGKSQISQNQPKSEEVRLALQSGPLLFKQSLPLTLNIQNDENTRRVVVAKTKKGEVAFIIFYFKPSPLKGPKLAELPLLLDEIHKKTNLKIESALNLDGGAHSAFFSENEKVPEISRIGSFFCIKP